MRGPGQRARISAAALLLLALAGCDEKPAPGTSTPPAPIATPMSSPPKPPTAPDETSRRARWDQRPTVEPPPELPKAWRALPAKIPDARLTAAHHELRSRVDAVPPYRHVHLELRIFGRDAEVEASLRDALSGLELPGLGEALPTAPVRVGDVTWSVEVHRLVAPPGEAREHRVELDWRRVPTDPPELEKCRRPVAVEPPAARPAWLSRPTDTRSTRRRISAAAALDAHGLRVTLRMRYHNGFAQDEAVGHLIEAARAAGLSLTEGSGPRQTWQGPAGRLTWEPDPDEMHLGCLINGPVIRILWSAPR